MWSFPPYFNSRPSARGDPNIRYLKGVINDFNSRPSARGDVLLLPSPTSGSKFQFTPLREGRRRQAKSAGSPRGISIHAPPRGATLLRRLEEQPEKYFNSRPSARGDLTLGQKALKTGAISIHAPPRGATNLRVLQIAILNKFQFTPLREGRQSNRCIKVFATEFQFTPLREGRRV